MECSYAAFEKRYATDKMRLKSYTIDYFNNWQINCLKFSSTIFPMLETFNKSVWFPQISCVWQFHWVQNLNYPPLPLPTSDFRTFKNRLEYEWSPSFCIDNNNINDGFSHSPQGSPSIVFNDTFCTENERINVKQKSLYTSISLHHSFLYNIYTYISRNQMIIYIIWHSVKCLHQYSRIFHKISYSRYYRW